MSVSKTIPVQLECFDDFPKKNANWTLDIGLAELFLYEAFKQRQKLKTGTTPPPPPLPPNKNSK